MDTNKKLRATFFASVMISCLLTLMTAVTVAAHDEGVAPRYEDPARQWCDQVLNILQRAQDQASTALSYGDYSRAKALLMQGLYQSRPSGTSAQRPLTARAIVRGIELAQSIQLAVRGAPNEARTNTHFLFQYYAFLFDTANGLDIPLYLPYHRMHRGCASCTIDPYDVELRFVQYAKEQVNVVLHALAETNGGQVNPLGSPRAFLKALELVTRYAASDLRESLLGSRYACATQTLEQLSYKLSCFNSGDHTHYRSEFEAVNVSYYEIFRILDEIQPNFGCSSSRH